jgi:DivIVA domain-containing protein
MLNSAAVLDARFTVTKFREGYEQAAVADFLARAGTALAAWEDAVPGTSALISADEVLALRFATIKFDNGFDQDEVDDLIARVAAALREYETAPVAPIAEPVAPPAGLLTSSTVTAIAFPIRRFHAGYSPAGVDGFLTAARELIAAHERGDAAADAPELGSADIVDVRFRPTWWRGGYDQDEVAAHLNDIIATLAYYERSTGSR